MGTLKAAKSLLGQGKFIPLDQHSRLPALRSQVLWQFTRDARMSFWNKRTVYLGAGPLKSLTKALSLTNVLLMLSTLRFLAR